MRKFFLIENAVPETNGRFIPVFPSVIFDFVILITAFLVRTDAGISSPWDVMPWGVFIFFGAASFFLLFFFSKLSAFARWLAISVHAAATYWIALITYRLGFGFDPFIHQAAERVLAEHGSALSGILYAGQYAGVLVLHWISHLSITWLDRLLVPCFGLFGILFIAWLSRKSVEKDAPFLLLVSLFFLPLSFLTFSIPFHLGVLFTIVVIVLLAAVEQFAIKLSICLLTVLALISHPLAGIPLCFLSGSLLFLERFGWKRDILIVLGIPLALLCAFGVYAKTAGSFIWPSLGEIRWSFLALFGSPYNPDSPFVWKAFYTAARAWPVLFIGLSLLGWKWTKSLNKPKARTLIATSIGIFLAAILAALVVRIPSIASEEQFEFPLRLLSLVPLFFLPGFSEWLKGTLFLSRPMVYRASACSMLAMIMVLQWYMSYPQFNPASDFSAPGLSRANIEAVDAIERMAQGESYAVLSDQMTSIAAVNRFGFSREIQTSSGTQFFYALPKSGILYQELLAILNEPDKSTIQQAFARIDAPILFLAIPESWAQDFLEKKLRPLVEQTRASGSIRLFEFRREDVLK